VNPPGATARSAGGRHRARRSAAGEIPDESNARDRFAATPVASGPPARSHTAIIVILILLAVAVALLVRVWQRDQGPSTPRPAMTSPAPSVPGTGT
jgi:hypothetical protein